MGALLAVLALSWPAAAGPSRVVPLPLEREAWYAIRWDNQLIGFSRYTIERSVALAGEDFYIVNSSSRVKLGAGEANDVSFTSKLMLNRETLQPSFFFCAQGQPPRTVEVECLFTGLLVAQKTRVGREEMTSTTNLSTASYLVFNNVWGRLDTFAEHYSVLFAAWEAAGKPKELPVYDPVLRATGTIRIQENQKTTVRQGTREVPARHYTLLDGRGNPIANAWLPEKGVQVLKLEDLRGGFTFTISDRKVEALVQRAEAVDLYKDRVQFSNVYFPNAQGLRSFRAEVDVRLHGTAVPQRQVRGFQQRFTGTAQQGQVKGQVQVSTAVVVVKDSDLFPRQKPAAASLAPFLAVEAGIESNEDIMKSKGEEVTWRARTSWEAARKVNTWVKEQMREGYSMPSARYVLDHGQASAEGRALLTVALLRAVRIPARVVGGVVFTAGNFVPHEWVEVWVGKDGWVAMDPTSGEAGTLGATHVGLWEQGDLVSVNIKVLDYGPRPPARVPFFNRELAWPVGQQRVYAVLHGGKEVGRETARVTGLTRVNGHDAYEVEFSADVTLAGKRTTCNAHLVVDPNVLPVSYSVTRAPADGKSETQQYSFGAGVARQTFRNGKEERVQETPISEGVYLGDTSLMSLWALIVGQYANPKIGDQVTIHVYRPDTHVTDDIALSIRQEEKIGVGGEERDTWRCEAADSVSLYIDKANGQVVRIEQPRQDLVLQLLESTMKI